MHLVRCKLVSLLFITIFFAHAYGMEDEIDIFNASQETLLIESDEVDKAINIAQCKIAQSLLYQDEEKVDEAVIQKKKRKSVKDEWVYRVACGKRGCNKKISVLSADRNKLTASLARHWTTKKHNKHFYEESSKYIYKECIQEGQSWKIACQKCGTMIINKYKEKLVTPYVVHRFGTALHGLKQFEKARAHVNTNIEENV